MKLFVLLFLCILTLGSKERENVADDVTASGEFGEIKADEPIVVKIEEDEYKVNNRGSSEYVGVTYDKSRSKWRTQRHSKNENKMVYNGTYDNEEEAGRASDTLARKFAENGEQGHKLNFPDDDTEVYGKSAYSSTYIGVTYRKTDLKWGAHRWNKAENKIISCGRYDHEETAAHASDTLARKLMENGELKLKLNFPDDETEVFGKKPSSKYIGVSYIEKKSIWRVVRWSRDENRTVSNGYYIDEKEAAHASDTLARELMENGEQNLKLNFPDDDTEVRQEEKNATSEYIGVTYRKNDSKWRATRWSKNTHKSVHNGCHDTEVLAAHASDTLARKLMNHGEQDHKLNFPEDETEVYAENKTSGSSQYIGVTYNKNESKWKVQRHSKNEKKNVFKGSHKDEETAAHASDTLAKQLMKNGEQGHKLNFPDDETELKTKRKRSDDLGNLQHN